ncbi:MAG: hypothetical protein QE160_06455 [Candidatus Verstraetearchaeota archaeon]|nr:hypothetical protein [Candidatus Verstraetearchaeota archaeon]
MELSFSDLGTWMNFSATRYCPRISSEKMLDEFVQLTSVQFGIENGTPGGPLVSLCITSVIWNTGHCVRPSIYGDGASLDIDSETLLVL